MATVAASRLLLDLARYLNLEKSSVTGLIDRAQRRGLVERATAPHDGRAIHVRLTAEGRGLPQTLNAPKRLLRDALTLIARTPLRQAIVYGLPFALAIFGCMRALYVPNDSWGGLGDIAYVGVLTLTIFNTGSFGSNALLNAALGRVLGGGA